jgi:tetratricopeptide (TPR) repeat protein
MGGIDVFGQQERPKTYAGVVDGATAETQSHTVDKARAGALAQPLPSPRALPELHRRAMGAVPGAERFEIREALASGGQATVFRAYDRESERQIAIKVFHRANSQQALKEEFRSLSGLRHPGIVQLHELYVGDEHGFFTMEYLEGVDIETFFRDAGAAEGAGPAPGRNWSSVRLAATQLALAIEAAHAAGLLHLDIKPNNIYVTPAGRVVLLDFGLVRRASGGRALARSRGGTHGYMPPEQLMGAALSEKSDWYAFGVVLHILLAGERPAAFRPGVDESSPSTFQFPGHAPVDLVSLCRDLLAYEPERRPGGRETLARLAALAPHHADRAGGLFVGRTRELGALEAAFDALAQGRATTAVVTVVGAAGIGKTTLVRRFCDELERNRGARLFAGRCFERAMIPYRLLDELMDRLADELVRAGGGQPAGTQPLPTPPALGLTHLVRLFPSFSRGPEAAPAPSGGASPAIEDAQHFLAQAVRELDDVLRQLSSPGVPSVIWLDDVHWSDNDSVSLLLEFLARNGVPLLLVLTSRVAEPSRLSRGIVDLARGGPALIATSLSLEGLCASDADDLVRQLAPAGRDVKPASWLRAEGNPLQIVELLRHDLAEAEPPPEASGAGELLTRLYIGRLARLDLGARQFLELVSLAAQPVRQDWLLDAGSDAVDGGAALQALSRAALIRIEAGRVEPSHDTIRSSVRDYLAPHQHRNAHRMLAATYRRHESNNHEALAYHLERAGELGECVVHLRQGADAAWAALAYDRAGALYERAHELLGGQSARPEPARIVRRAIECRMLSGRFEQAEPQLRELLARVGLPVFESERSAQRHCLLELVRLLLQGMPELTPAPPQADERGRTRLDVCLSALRGYSTHDTFRGAVYGLIYLRLARGSGDPRSIALGIVHVASFLTFANLGWTRRYGERLLARGVLVAGGDPELAALLETASGTQALFAGQWRSAYEKMAVRQGSGSGGDFGPEWNLAAQMSLIALDHLGWMDVLRRRARELLDAGRACGNGMVEAESHVWCALAEVAADHLEAARHHLQRAEEEAPNLGFLFIHWSVLRVRTLSYLYEGDTRRALSAWNEGRAGLQRSGLLGIQFVRVLATELEALVTAGEASSGRLPRRAALGTLRRMARRLAKEGTAQARASCHVVQANEALLSGRRERGLRELERASLEYARADMLLRARSAQLCADHLGGAGGGRGRVDAEAQRMGVHDSLRWALVLVPGSGCPTSTS